MIFHKIQNAQWKMRHTEHNVWKCTSNKECILNKGDKPLTGVGALHNWHRMASTPWLRPVSTTATHIQSMLRGKRNTTHGCPMWKNWWIFSGIYWQSVLSYYLPFPDDLHYQSMGKSPKSPFSMVIFTTRKTVPIVQARPPLHYLSSPRGLCFFLASGNITLKTASMLLLFTRYHEVLALHPAPNKQSNLETWFDKEFQELKSQAGK